MGQALWLDLRETRSSQPLGSGRTRPPSVDLFKLVHDPATLYVAWRRIDGNTGARSAGVDGRRTSDVEDVGVQAFLDKVREGSKLGQFRPIPVRER